TCSRNRSIHLLDPRLLFRHVRVRLMQLLFCFLGLAAESVGGTVQRSDSCLPLNVFQRVFGLIQASMDLIGLLLNKVERSGGTVNFKVFNEIPTQEFV